MTVKRYEPSIKTNSHSTPCMDEDSCGQYVLHSDYAAAVAERDKLARSVCAVGASCVCPFCACTATHTPGCPVALAERITREAGDGR